MKMTNLGHIQSSSVKDRVYDVGGLQLFCSSFGSTHVTVTNRYVGPYTIQQFIREKVEKSNPT